MLRNALALLLLAGCASSSQTTRPTNDESFFDEDGSPEAYKEKLERDRRKLMTQAELDEEDDKKALESLTAADVVAASLTKFGKEPATYCPWSTNELTVHVKTRQGRVLALGRRELEPMEPQLQTTPATLVGTGLQLAQAMGAGIGIPPAKVSVTVSFKGTTVMAREDFVPEWGCTSGVVFDGDSGSRGSEGADGSSAPKRGQGGKGENGGTGGTGMAGLTVTAEAAFVVDAQKRRFVLVVAEGPDGEKKWALRPAGEKVTVFAKGGRGGKGGAAGRGGSIGACPVGKAGDGGDGGRGGDGGSGGTVTVLSAGPEVTVEVNGGDGGSGGDAGASGRAKVRCDDDVEREGREGSYGSTGKVGATGAPGKVTQKTVPAAKLKRIAEILAAGSGFKLE